MRRPGDPPDVSGFGCAPEVLSARVTRVVEGACSFGEDLVCRRATFELQEGPDIGTTTFEEWELIPSAPQFIPGDRVVLNRIPEAPALQRYQFADRERRPLLIGAGLLFATLVIVLGRLRGLAALGGLILSIGVLLLYIVPA